MNIGEAARASGVSAKMIRYYEDRQLIRPAVRTASGYRTYSDSDVYTLGFIRRARNLGFTVEEITRLLALWQDPSRSSADVKRLAAGHVAGLERKIAELQAMADTLRDLGERCCGDSRPDCPILRDLASPEGTAARLEDSGPSRLGPA